MEPASLAINQRRIEGHHQPTTYWEVATLHCLYKSCIDSVEIIADQRQNTEQIVPNICPLYFPADSFGDFGIRLAKDQHIANGAEKRVVIKGRSILY